MLNYCIILVSFSIRMGKCSERELNKINFLLKKISMFIIIAFVQWQRPYWEWPLTEITMTLLRKVWLSFSAEMMIGSHFITTTCLFYPANVISPFLNNPDVVWVAPLAFFGFVSYPSLKLNKLDNFRLSIYRWKGSKCVHKFFTITFNG